VLEVSPAVVSGPVEAVDETVDEVVSAVADELVTAAVDVVFPLVPQPAATHAVSSTNNKTAIESLLISPASS